jgi:hypothetical protein
MAKQQQREEWTELIEVVSVPSPMGDLDIKFRIMATDEGKRFLDIARMRGTYRLPGGITVALDEISTVREAFDAIDDAIKESVSV